MRITDNFVLKELGLTRGQILTLDELDERIISAVDEEYETNLMQGMEATEILDMRYYVYYIDDDCPPSRVYFEVVNNTGDIDSTIKIV